MAKRLFVGNLSYNTSDAELADAFKEFGQVRQATVVTDRESGRSRGFGFVEFDDDGAAAIAIQAMNGQSLAGRSLVVNEAHERQGGRGGGGGGRPPRDFGGGGGGGDRRGGRGGGRGGRDRDRRRNEWE